MPRCLCPGEGLGAVGGVEDDVSVFDDLLGVFKRRVAEVVALDLLRVPLAAEAVHVGVEVGRDLPGLCHVEDGHDRPRPVVQGGGDRGASTKHIDHDHGAVAHVVLGDVRMGQEDFYVHRDADTFSKNNNKQANNKEAGSAPGQSPAHPPRQHGFSHRPDKGYGLQPAGSMKGALVLVFLDVGTWEPRRLCS